MPIVERVRAPITRVLADAKLQPQDVDKIILIGGQTRMPLVRKFVEEAVGKPAERGVDPMECVAVGAAIQGAVLAGEVKDLLLLDVTPLSLGVETLGGVSTKILERNTTIPTKRSQIFSTAGDFQTTVTIHVLQGERPMAVDNVSLGMFNLSGIPPAPRGVPQIEVTFDIDANGIINVSAKDLGTSKEAKITITASTKLSKEEKERMIKQAEEFAEADKKKVEEAETRNSADSMLYTAEKTKTDLKDKISQDQVAKIDKAIGDLRTAMAGKDVTAIKSAADALSKVLQEVGASVYQKTAEAQAKQQASQAAPGPESQQGGATEPGQGAKVVDADYKVVDEEKK
jgi:molecular chaperone DnaK